MNRNRNAVEGGFKIAQNAVIDDNQFKILVCLPSYVFGILVYAAHHLRINNCQARDFHSVKSSLNGRLPPNILLCFLNRYKSNPPWKDPV